MKQTLLFILLATILVGTKCYAQTGQALVTSKAAGTVHPSPYNLNGSKFPQIEADNRVTFQFRAPDAQKVQVSLNNKPFDMVKNAEGVWTYTSEPQDLGYHNYWMVVDGAVVLDPATYAFVGYSHNCNGFEVADPDGGFYDLKDVPHGNVLIRNYFSKTTNGWRHIYIYTPPGYDESQSTRYPVLYIQHGGGEDERVWIEMGRTNLILDNLIAEKKCKPFIAVMETSAAMKPGETPPMPRQAAAPAPNAPAPAGGQAGAAPRPRMSFSFDTYREVMTKDLIPFIDSNFRTLSDAKNRGMCGLSMGAMCTKAVTMASLDVFSYIGMFSGGTIAPNEISDKSKVNLVFMSYGSREGGSANVKNAADALQQAGIKSASYVSPLTAHEWQSWRRSLREFAPLIFRN